MLELAKVAYNNKLVDAKEDEKKVIETKICETLLLLGEVSLESENYKQAVADINDCLAKRKVRLTSSLFKKNLTGSHPPGEK